MIICAVGKPMPIMAAHMNQPAPYLQQRNDGVCVMLKVQPRASRSELGGVIGNELMLKVTASPVDSAANEAVLNFLAEVLDRPRNAIQLVRGQTSRHKEILIRGASLDEVKAKLEGAQG